MPLYLLATGLHLAAPSPSRSESDSPLTNRHEKGKEERVKPSSGGRISQSGYNTTDVGESGVKWDKKVVLSHTIKIYKLRNFFLCYIVERT